MGVNKQMNWEKISDKCIFHRKSSEKCNFLHIFKKIISLLMFLTKYCVKSQSILIFHHENLIFPCEEQGRNNTFQIWGVGKIKDFWPKYLPITKSSLLIFYVETNYYISKYFVGIKSQ